MPEGDEMEFRLGELFSGPGGLGWGVFKARVSAKGQVWSVRHAWINDIDADACRTYARNIPVEKAFPCPVKDLDLSRLPPFNALAFGFPCNDYSIVGERRGINGEYGPLYTYGAKVINQFNPDWFIAENVSGLENANSGTTFTKILEDLANAGEGYRLTTHLYRFEDYGVPQRRHRIIIVGIREALRLNFQVPAPTTKDSPITASEALLHPPIPADAPNHELTKHPQKTVERLEALPPGKNAWYEGLPKHLRLNVKRARLSQIYRRLHPDEPAYTITGSGGGGTHAYHWKEPRALTNRERARLQTFPDSFVFEGPKESVRRQVGMAVPPLGARIIVQSILKTFAGQPYAVVEPHWKDAISTPLILVSSR